MNDEVRVIIDGKELTGWEAVTIEMAVDHIADGFSIDAPWDPARIELRKLFQPFGYQAVQLFIDDDRYLTGLMDKPKPFLSDSDRKINLQGRSLTGQLADCMHRPNPDGSGMEYSNFTLAQWARVVCRPFGISVRADNDTVAIPEARCDYGQGAADFLNSLAGPRHILLNASYLGELILTSGGSLVNKTPGARLVEGEFPVTGVESDFDGTKRFSVFQVAAQFAGAGDILDTAYDNTVKIYRPHASVVAAAITSPEDQAALLTMEQEVAAQTGESAAKAKGTMLKLRSAARTRAASLAESVSVNVNVTGWRRPDGKRWAERQTVTLLAPSAMIYHEVPWLIAGVTLRLDAQGGRASTLRLVLPETYSGTMPKDTPWVA